MYRYKLIMFFAIVAVIVGSTLTAFPQGRRQPTQGQTVTKGTPDRDRSRDQDTARDQDRDRDRDKYGGQEAARIRATDQQRDQMRAELGDMDRIRTQLREMARDCEHNDFTPANAKGQHEQLRERYRNMEQEHERFMLGLNDDQRKRFREESGVMQQHRERINNRLQLMEQELNQGQFDRLQHRARLREIEKAIKKWQNQVRDVEKHMLNN